MAIPIAALAPILLIAIAFIGYCLVDIARQPRTRYLPKPVWMVLSVVSVPLGGILYLLFGHSFRAVDRSGVT
jgi:Phospholipase_D-nuclease N-terminal